jgi:predicted phosphoribosyltransferase
MSAPARMISPDEDVAEAAARMAERRIGCLPVVSDGAIVGMLTRTDVLALERCRSRLIVQSSITRVRLSARSARSTLSRLARIMAIFRDRVDAGQLLAVKLQAYRGRPDVFVLGLARGGVPVAEQVALALGAPFDVFVVRKVGVPGDQELAMGAVASGGVRIRNEDVIDELGIEPEVFESAAEREMGEVRRLEHAYRDDRPPAQLGGRTVILADDGIATGVTMGAAVRALRAHGPARVIAAVPVAPRGSCQKLESVADLVICAATPRPFITVGQWYEDFDPTTDEEVREALERGQRSFDRVEAGAPSG